ncbi:hypothetical protein GGR45_003929, partial [Sphingomonas zeae]
MTSISTNDYRQQAASEPSQSGSDDGQPVTISTILQRVLSRQEAVEDADDAVPLLGLEPTTVEKAGENSTMPEDSNHHARLTPLLGTI